MIVPGSAGDNQLRKYTMNPSTNSLTERPAWGALTSHAAAQAGVHLRQLFAQDPARGTRFVREAVGVYLVFSKKRVS